MLNFIYENGKMVAVTEDYTPKAVNRNDIQNMAHAEEIAQDATTLSGKLHVACDRGNSTWPRFDVIAAPVVGAEVSKAFNGDYYPAGKIVSVSKSLKLVTTDKGEKFYRRGQTGTWLEGRMWAMVPGTITRQNPSF